MSANIFISFAAQDRKVAITLCQALESRGFKCWISGRDILPGENFQIAIVRAIRKAKLMLLVFTANSNNSEEMNKELALASQQKLTVVPLRIEDVAPNDAFAYEFATRQWIDFFADWELAMGALASQIANVLGPDAPPLTATGGAVTAAVASPVDSPVARVAPPAVVEPAPAPAAPPIAEPEAELLAPPAVPQSVEAPAPEPEAIAAPVAEAPVVLSAEPVAAELPPVESAADEASTAEPERPPSAKAQPANPPASDAKVAKKGSPLPLIIGAIVVLAAAAAAGVVFLGKKPTATPAVAASTAAAPVGPTVTLATPVAPAAAAASTAPAAVVARSIADTAAAADSATTVAAEAAAGPKIARHRPKADANGPAPLRASRSDIPY